MSDYRELLELAAKAAAIDAEAWPDDEDAREGLWLKGERTLDNNSMWNPRDDDGDAFRLAGALNMTIEFSEEHGCCEASTENFGANEHYINYGGDRMAAARMAVLIAAAERGKAMRREEALQEMVDEGQRLGLYDMPEGK